MICSTGFASCSCCMFEFGRFMKLQMMNLKQPLLLLSMMLATGTVFAAEHPKDPFTYLDNGVLRIGVDQSRGAAIGYFALARDKRNLLNHHDEGRFIQQSYYGDADGSMWGKKPWRYNPVQGG